MTKTRKTSSTCGLVYPVHMFVELRSVTVVVVVVVGDEQEGVDHLVEEGLHQVLPRAQLQQWDRDT